MGGIYIFIVLLLGWATYWVLTDSARRYGKTSWILAALVPITFWFTAFIYFLKRLVIRPSADVQPAKPQAWHYAAAIPAMLIVAASGVSATNEEAAQAERQAKQQAAAPVKPPAPTPKPTPTRKLTAKELAAKKEAEKKAEAERKRQEAEAAKQAALAAKNATVAKVKELNSYIIGASVEDDGRRLDVVHFRPTILDEKSYIFEAGEDIMKIMQGMANDVPNDFEKVSFELFAPTTDKYGNSSKGQAMRLTYDMDEVRKINWDNFNNWDMLNFASDAAFTPLGRQAALAFCADDTHGKYSRNFCAKLLE